MRRQWWAFVLGIVLVILPTLPSAADDPEPVPVPAEASLTVAAPTAAYAGATTPVTATLTTADAPVAGVQVGIERHQGAAWVSAGSATTDALGQVVVPVVLAKVPADNLVRATWAGDETTAPATSDPVALGLLRRPSTLKLSGAKRVVDETSTTLTARWVANDGEPVVGRVTFVASTAGRSWRTAGTVTTDHNGVARFVAAPRADTRWIAKAAALPWVLGAQSAQHALNNVPPGVPVKLPRGAPRPRRLTTQPHAVGAGAHPVITAVPATLWSTMVGRTWHSGCPIGRANLRLIQINYWDFTGYRRRGQLVVNMDVAAQIAAAVTDLYRHKIPIRSMVTEDRFGWSAKLHGANDLASMRTGNSSAFNCRGVVGNPRVLSPHAWGRALDLDTWENPYRSAHGIVPDVWWQRHSNKRYAWRSRKHLVVRIMASHGLRWTYGLGDTQHFDAVPTGSRRVDPVIDPPTPTIRCGVAVCD